jgi:hypothetical protein
VGRTPRWDRDNHDRRPAALHQALPLSKHKVNSCCQALRERARWLCNRRGLTLFFMVREVTVDMSADGSYNPRLTRRVASFWHRWVGPALRLRWRARRPPGGSAREGQTWYASRRRRRPRDRTLGQLTTSCS